MTIRITYPEGKIKALTMSYDDGVQEDIRLIEIFNEYGIKGSFHLNSSNFDKPGRIASDQVKDIYKGHEVSCHSSTHPFLERVPAMEAMREVWLDRQKLESLAGYPVVGMSYPMGTYSDSVIAILKGAGIKCCRTTLATGKFHLPNDFLAWHPTCHHRNMLELLPQFLECRYGLSIFFVWGHAYEFPRNDNWGDMESFCKQISGKQEIWYATNIEICRYLTAMYQLEISVDGSLIYNPTATEIWFTANGNLMSIKAGQSIQI